MTPLATEIVERVQTEFEPHRDEAAARAMSAYMRNLFPFLGIPSPARRLSQRGTLAGLPRPNHDDLVDAGTALWRLPEREYQYAALDLLIRNVRSCKPGFITTTRQLITTKSWWDTVDPLASRVVGPLVLRNQGLVTTMDAWIADRNLWLRRTAILHQLSYRDHTDEARLFRYCLAQAGDADFFIRKAIGWALRQYSKTNEAAVRTFVAERQDQLSPLSAREALLWLNGGRNDTRVSARLEGH